MSEYTTVYLRYKNTPLLEYREHPSFEETRNLSKDEIITAIHEVDEYNKNVRKSFGCELFHLSMFWLPLELQQLLPSIKLCRNLWKNREKSKRFVP